MNQITTPAHTHDCSCCTYHGSVKDASGEMLDLYACNNTAVVRYGSDGPEYSSMSFDMLKMLGPGRAKPMLYTVMALAESNAR